MTKGVSINIADLKSSDVGQLHYTQLPLVNKPGDKVMRILKAEREAQRQLKRSQNDRKRDHEDHQKDEALDIDKAVPLKGKRSKSSDKYQKLDDDLEDGTASKGLNPLKRSPLKLSPLRKSSDKSTKSSVNRRERGTKMDIDLEKHREDLHITGLLHVKAMKKLGGDNPEAAMFDEEYSLEIEILGTVQSVLDHGPSSKVIFWSCSETSICTNSCILQKSMENMK